MDVDEAKLAEFAKVTVIDLVSMYVDTFFDTVCTQVW